MKILPVRLVILFYLIVVAVVTNAEAVIVAGANGVGSANTSGTELNDELGAAFPFFDNVVAVGNGSGTYLGQSDGSGWVITAKHVTTPSAISIAGASYAVDTTFDLSGADVSLVKIELGPVAPGLPSVSIGGAAAIGDQTVMIGFGRSRVESAASKPNKSDAVSLGGGIDGYNWDSDRIKRWGLNVVDASPSTYFGIQGGQNVTALPAVGNGFFTTFDEPTKNFLASNEAQASSGDSGGAVFTQDANGNWQLTGVMSQIFTSFGQSSGTAGFTNLTASVYLADYESELAAFGAIGTPVPEPSVGILSLFGAGICFMRRRRQR